MLELSAKTQNTFRPYMRSELFSRRQVVALTSAAALGALTPACRRTVGEVRRFGASAVFHWEPQEIVRDIAFSMVADQLLDYVDAKCYECGVAIRLFTFAANVAVTAATIACPECAAGTRITLAISRALVGAMIQYGFTKAVGVMIGNGEYEVHKVAPVLRGPHTLAVMRSAACYGIENHEPVDRFDRLIPALPERICYFTDVSDAAGTEIVHVWRHDGVVTDRILLQIGSDRFRTYSRKYNLATGTWILTAELPSGEILDSREFHIARR